MSMSTPASTPGRENKLGPGRLGGQFKTGHLWTPQNRPFPAPETGR